MGVRVWNSAVRQHDCFLVLACVFNHRLPLQQVSRSALQLTQLCLPYSISARVTLKPEPLPWDAVQVLAWLQLHGSFRVHAVLRLYHLKP